MTTTVLIVDDDVLVRAGLRLMIETQPDLSVVGEAGDGAAAIELAESLQPDIVLMDIRMPGVDGLQATRRITASSRHDPAIPAEHPGPRVIVLTTFEIDEYVYEAVRAGASGFLLKRTPPEELLNGIRTVAEGDALLAPSVTRRLLAEFAKATSESPKPTGVRNRSLDRLTEREREVLVLIAQGLSNAEIARTVYVAETTVKTHVRRILMKLELRDRVHAVVYAFQTGLVTRDD